MPRTRITKAKIDFLSLCPRGVNEMPVLYKADDTFVFETLTKASEDAGEILAVVYAPEITDLEGEFASAEVIKEMAYDFAQRRGSVDIRHNGIALPSDKAFVAESFIVAKGDERFSDFKNAKGEAVNVVGGWAAVVKVNDPDLRKLYREGKWNGISMGGSAKRAVEKSDEGGIAAWFTNLIKSLKQETPPMSMTPEQIAKLVGDEVKKALDAAGVKAPEAPKPLTQADIDAAVAKALAAAKPAPTADEAKATDLKKAQDELKAAQDRITALEGKSGAPAGESSTVAKEAAEHAACGERIAKFAASRRA